jgi:hypothetical protein
MISDSSPKNKNRPRGVARAMEITNRMQPNSSQHEEVCYVLFMMMLGIGVHLGRLIAGEQSSIW